MRTFKAWVVRENDNKEVTYQLEDVDINQLDEGEVIIEVHYSSLNYKDMLGFQTKGGVIRHYPMIPGIDLSGVVVESNAEEIKAGQKVVITGRDLGVKHTGGLSEYARVPASWVFPIPDTLDLKDAMIYGTAGFTAAQSVYELESHGMSPENNPHILVTGASGGVGSIALSILHKIGYRNVSALIRKDYQEELVLRLGAQQVVWADDIGKKKTLGSRKYNYILDTVGGEVAATLIPQIYEKGSMSLCGNAGGIELNTTVMPLIIRGINLLGINSIIDESDADFYRLIWDKLATDWHVAKNLTVEEISLDEVDQTITALKDGKHLGRTIVKVKG